MDPSVIDTDVRPLGISHRLQKTTARESGRLQILKEPDRPVSVRHQSQTDETDRKRLLETRHGLNLT